MLALPSPPDDSERTPGTERSTSAALNGAPFLIVSPSSVLMETLDFIFDELPVLPVTTTRSRFRPSGAGAASCAAAPPMCRTAAATATARPHGLKLWCSIVVSRYCDF